MIHLPIYRSIDMSSHFDKQISTKILTFFFYQKFDFSFLFSKFITILCRSQRSDGFNGCWCCFRKVNEMMYVMVVNYVSATMVPQQVYVTASCQGGQQQLIIRVKAIIYILVSLFKNGHIFFTCSSPTMWIRCKPLVFNPLTWIFMYIYSLISTVYHVLELLALLRAAGNFRILTTNRSMWPPILIRLLLYFYYYQGHLLQFY